MTARVSMLLKSRASLTCFRACFLPGRAKDLSAPRVKGPPCCKVIRTVKEKIKRQSIYPVIFVTNLTTCYLPKRQASSFQDKRQGAQPPPPQLPSLAVRRGKIRDNCNILRVGTLDSFRFSIAFLIDSSNGRSNNGSADCNFLLQMCVYGPRPFGQLTHGDIVTKKKFTVATEDKEICIFFHLLKSP